MISGLPNPKMMDVAVPANLHVGLEQHEIDVRGWSATCDQLRKLFGQPGVVLVDLRETTERRRHGFIPGSVHAPYGEFPDQVKAGSILP